MIVDTKIAADLLSSTLIHLYAGTRWKLGKLSILQCFEARL